MIDKLKELVNSEIDFVFDNEISFMFNFGYMNSEGHELTSVSFSSEYIHFSYYNVDSGQHFSDAVSLIEYDNWKERILND